MRVVALAGVVGEGEVVGRDFRRHPDTLLLGTADQLDRAARRHMTQVDVTPGEPGEQDVTPHHDLLRRSRNALQPEAGRNEAFVHHATRGEGRLLAMVRDRNPEAPGVLERGAHHVARDDGLPVVRYRDGAGADQLAELGELLAVLAHRNRPDRVDPREPGADRLTYDEADRGLVVRHGIGVRHRTHGGEPTGRRGARAAGDSLDVFVPRLPQVHVHVHQAGTDHLAAHTPHVRAKVVGPGLVDVHVHLREPG